MDCSLGCWAVSGESLAAGAVLAQLLLPGPPVQQGAREPPFCAVPGSVAAGAGGSAMAAARRFMALAAGVSPRLRPPGPRAAGRQGRSRGFSSGCARPDRTKEAAEAEAGVAPCRPEEGDGSMVNGEGSGEGGRAVTPLTPGNGRVRGAGRGRALAAGRALRWWPGPPSLAGRNPALLKLRVAQAQMDPERGGSRTGGPAPGKNR